MSDETSKDFSNICSIRIDIIADITPLRIDAPAILDTVSASIIGLLRAVVPKTQATWQRPMVMLILTTFDRDRTRHIIRAATVVAIIPVMSIGRLCPAIRHITNAVHVPVAIATLPLIKIVVSIGAIATGSRNCEISSGIIPVDEHR